MRELILDHTVERLPDVLIPPKDQPFSLRALANALTFEVVSCIAYKYIAQSIEPFLCQTVLAIA
jgi:hypothetical protein